VAVAAATLLAALAAAPAAFGHATLLSTQPSQDSVVAESPGTVLLRFDEPVEGALGSVRVYNGRAEQVDSGEITRPSPDSVAVPVDERLDRGTYTVAWRVISADSDPISGAFTFHVEEPGPHPAGVAAEVLEDTPALTSVLYTTGRGIDYALLLLCVGGIAVLGFALGSAPGTLRRRLFRILGASALALAVVALVGIVLQGAAGSGLPISEALNWDDASSVLETRFGEFSLLRVALALTIAALALGLSRSSRTPHPAVWIALGLAAVGLIVTPVASGHASTAGALQVTSDLAHVQAAAIWVGGLAMLMIALAAAGADDRWRLAGAAVPRFSNLALVAVGVLIAAGVVNGLYQVGAWRGLWDTTYGLLLLAKIALILPLLALGAFNNRYSVPRLRRGITSLVDRRRFARAAGAELLVMVSIVGVTAVLVNASPARDEVVHEMATHELRLGPLDAHVTVDPAMTGRNEIHVALEENGEPAEVDELRLSAALPSRELGPLAVKTRPGGAHGEHMAEANLPIAGGWELRIEARRGKFELFAGTASIEIEQE
jgi:copper transport protein